MWMTMDSPAVLHADVLMASPVTSVKQTKMTAASTLVGTAGSAQTLAQDSAAAAHMALVAALVLSSFHGVAVTLAAMVAHAMRGWTASIAPVYPNTQAPHVLLLPISMVPSSRDDTRSSTIQAMRC